MPSSKLSLKDTQFAIEKLKDLFSHQLHRTLNLVRVSAPLFVKTKSGLNDGLNGEKPVVFFAYEVEDELQIIHSLAKWKRNALKKYEFGLYEGIYTDMNAIRKQEKLDYKHSIYVDQWDWELIIKKEDRNLKYLKHIVKLIYGALKNTEKSINRIYPVLSQKLAKNIYFISSSHLYNLYPNLSPEEREEAICKEYGSVFIYQIGYNLPDGIPHSKRAFDYDDWMLNGDLIVYDSVNKKALEISSMGIRVDKDSLIKQSNKTEEEIKKLSPYHCDLIEGKLPYTIGGGLGQSRIAMFLLEKHHIGEVQASAWDQKTLDESAKENIIIL